MGGTYYASDIESNVEEEDGKKIKHMVARNVKKVRDEPLKDIVVIEDTRLKKEETA